MTPRPLTEKQQKIQTEYREYFHILTGYELIHFNYLPDYEAFSFEASPDGGDDSFYTPSFRINITSIDWVKRTIGGNVFRSAIDDENDRQLEILKSKLDS